MGNQISEPGAAARGNEPRIDHLGLWTWGGRVYHWRRYLDHMHATGMDTVVLWHDRAPHNAREILAHAAGLGIRVQWGMNWSWNTPVCLDSELDSAVWTARVLDMLKYEYIPWGAESVVFQTGGTELENGCRRGCNVCRQAAAGEGLGMLYVKFVTPILDAVRREYPRLEICANVHLGSIQRSYEALAAIDPAIQIMWEDLPGPGWRIEVPFAYDWAPEAAATSEETLAMVRRMCELRGPREDVAFVVKGFPCRWGGGDPMLLEPFELEPLAKMAEAKWEAAARSCEARLADALGVFQTIARSPARRKSVLLLVEAGLWEWKRSYAAVLIAEAARNPFRRAEEVIAAAREAMATAS